MNKKLLGIGSVALALLVGIGIGSMNNNSSENEKAYQEFQNKDTSIETYKKEIGEDTIDTKAMKEVVKEEPKVENKPVQVEEWRGHKLPKKYIQLLESDKYCVVITDIKKVNEFIRFKYIFINESGDTATPSFTFSIIPYQDGISLNDNKEYSSIDWDTNGNEHTTIQSGYEMEKCIKSIPYGSGNEITGDVNVGFWNTVAQIRLDPKTLECEFN